MSDLIYSAIGRALARLDLARRRFAAQHLAADRFDVFPDDDPFFIAYLEDLVVIRVNADIIAALGTSDFSDIAHQELAP